MPRQHEIMWSIKRCLNVETMPKTFVGGRWGGIVSGGWQGVSAISVCKFIINIYSIVRTVAR